MDTNATIIELADRIASTLNAKQTAPQGVDGWTSPFVLPFTARRTVNPLDYGQLANDSVCVLVFPAGITESRLGIDGGASPAFSQEATVHVIVYRHCPPAEAEDTGATMLLLCQQLAEAFKGCVLNMPRQRVVLTEIDNDPAFDVDRMAKDNLFAGEQVWTWNMVTA